MREASDKPSESKMPTRLDQAGAAGEVGAQLKQFAPTPRLQGEAPAYLEPARDHPLAKYAQNALGPDVPRNDASIAPRNDSLDTPKSDAPTALGGTPSSGRKQEYAEDGFPIGGRPNDDYKWEKYKQADDWSASLQKRSDLNDHEKFAAGRMGLQLERRANDPIRDDAAWHDTPDQRIGSAQRTLKEWNQDMTTLQGKLNADQAKLATQVQAELETELKQEEWRKQRFVR